MSAVAWGRYPREAHSTRSRPPPPGGHGLRPAGGPESRAPEARIDRLPIVEETLENGLRVVLDPDPSVPVVGIAVYYDVGSRNEVPGASGFAHLFEHMMFQGSAHVGKAEHFRLVHGWGGEVNGTTSQDCTNYFEALPADQLSLGLWLEADRMRSLAVTPENFENQRQTVMEERRQRVDDSPYGPAMVRLGELSYACWAYAHPVVGYWQDLEAARWEDVLAFHRTWYRPDNAVLAIAGDLDPLEVMERVRAWFGDIERGGPRPAPDLREPARGSPVFERVRDPLARLPAVVVNHQAPGFDSPDFYVHEIIETLLFRGPSSRVYRRLVVDEAAAVQVSGGYDARRGPSTLGVFAAVPAGCDPARAAALYGEELGKIGETPVGAEEMEKAKNQLRAARVFGRESALYRALALGRSVLFHGEAAWDEAYLDRIGEVTPEDVRRVAARDLRQGHAVVLEVEPA